MTLLSHYWRDDDPTALTQALARDWADALESLPRSAIDMACKDYLRTQTRKPTPAAIAITASALVRHSLPPREPEPGREPRVTPERAAEIMREVYGTDQP